MKAAILNGYRSGPTYNLSTEQSFRYITKNIGNMMFKYAVTKHFPTCDVIFSLKDPDEIREKYDLLILPLANQINPRVDLLKLGTKLEKIGIATCILGIGAQLDLSSSGNIQLQEGTIFYLKTISELSNFIGVRGSFTQEILYKFGIKNTKIIGCPSNFISTDSNLGNHIDSGFENVRQKEEERLKIGFYPQLGANLKNESTLKSESLLLNLCFNNNGHYIINAPVNFISLARGRYDEIDEKHIKGIYKKIGNQDVLYKNFRQDFIRHSLTFTSIQSWLEYSSSLSLSIGKRIHGALNTIQAGNPGVMVYHDSRTRELSTDLGLPRISIQDFEELKTISEVLDGVTWNKGEYELKRKQLFSNYKDIMTSYGLEIKNVFEESIFK